MIQRILLLLAILLSTSVPAAFADQAKPASETLAGRLAQIDELLRSGGWSPAEKAAREELARSRKSFSASVLGAVLARLAVAEAGLGREEDALWHWQLAQSLDRTVLPEGRLRAFGAPGELLSRHPLRSAGQAPAGLEVRHPGGAVLPARRPSGDLPALSPALQSLSVPLWLRAQVIIDAEGRPGHPVVLSTSLPGLAFEVLEALRAWRFEPAREGGRPVAAFYQLTLNPLTEKPLAEMAPLETPALVKIHDLLRTGRWKEANKKARKLWTAGLARSLDWSSMGVLLTLRALAEAGLGSHDEAICRWQAAQHLEPRLYHADLSAYGGAGELLEANRWGVALADGDPTKAGEPPLPVKSPAPARAQFILRLPVTAIIDTEGHVRQPVLLIPRQPPTPPAISDQGKAEVPLGWPPAMDTLETVCSWRFKPAGSGDEPRMATVSWTMFIDQLRTDSLSGNLSTSPQQRKLDPRPPVAEPLSRSPP